MDLLLLACKLEVAVYTPIRVSGELKAVAVVARWSAAVVMLRARFLELKQLLRGGRADEPGADGFEADD